MSYLLEEELTSRGVATKTSLKIRFNHKIYVRVKTLPRQFYQQGLKLKEEYTAQSRDSLLIGHKTWISIWLEELNQLEEIENNDCELRPEVFSPPEEHNFSLTDLPQISALDDKDPLITHEFETSTSSQKYQGVAYQDSLEQFSNSCSHSSSHLDQSKQLNQKYRGVVDQETISDHNSPLVTQSKPMPNKVSRSFLLTKINNNWQQTINWRSLSGILLLVPIVVVGTLGRNFDSVFPRTRNSVVSLVNTLEGKENGLIVTQARTTTTIKNDQSTPSQLISSEKTLWDYLEISSQLAIPILLLVFGYQFQQREQKRTEQQAQLSREIARDKLAEEAIQFYLDSMANLWLEQKQREGLFRDAQLNSSARDHPVWELACLKTIIILRRLDGDRERQARIIHFLQDAELDKFIWQNAHLSGVNLSGINLSGANLSGANLSGVNLSGANLSGANLLGAELGEANLEKANLLGTELSEANLERAYLGQANLEKANLERVNLKSTNLEKTNLSGAKLINIQNLRLKQLKLAYLWSQAIYQADEQENQLYIEDLKKPQPFDPSIPVDFQLWEKWH